jgi:ABC-type amino acid transport substrate-binding protein
VGYYADALPFSFTNQKGDLVGFDIEMAHILAQEMNVQLELVNIDRSRVAELLNNGTVDVAMSGIAVTTERTIEMGLTIPYMDQTLALVVKDYRLNEFNSREKVKAHTTLKLATVNAPYYIQKVKNYVPQADLEILDSPLEFFARDDLDAFVYSAEAGAAWSLLYPEYTVAIPYPDVLELPVAYAIAKGETELKDYVDTWIDLKKKDRTISMLYDQWILGKNISSKEPRWSIIKNVLHWVS